MENDTDNLVYGAVGAAIGAGLAYYAKCYLLRTRGRQAVDRFTWKVQASALSFVMLLIGGFFWLPDLPVALQNTAAVIWMVLLAALMFGPFLPLCAYARRESQYRRRTR